MKFYLENIAQDISDISDTRNHVCQDIFQFANNCHFLPSSISALSILKEMEVSLSIERNEEKTKRFETHDASCGRQKKHQWFMIADCISFLPSL